jgi:hypothetical protein
MSPKWHRCRVELAGNEPDGEVLRQPQVVPCASAVTREGLHGEFAPHPPVKAAGRNECEPKKLSGEERGSSHLHGFSLEAYTSSKTHLAMTKGQPNFPPNLSSPISNTT